MTIIAKKTHGGGDTLTYLLGVLLAFMVSQVVLAEERTWNVGVGGTEAEPLDIYQADNWNPSGVPSLSDNLIFANTFEEMAFLMNGSSSADSISIANNIKFNKGRYTVLGTLKFATLENSSKSGALTIVKKGNWVLTYAMYLCRDGNSVNFTNVSGNLTCTSTSTGRRFQIGNGGKGPCVVENLSGNWQAGCFSTIGDACKNTTFNWRSGNLDVTHTSNPLGIGYNIGSDGVVNVLKDAGDWSLSGGMLLNHGIGVFTHNGGTTTVVNDKSTVLAGKSGANSILNLNGGVFKTKELLRGEGSATLVFDGGELSANATSENGLIGEGVSVKVASNGGVINASGYAVSIKPEIGGIGAMSFKGGGSVTLTAEPTYTGMTTIEIGTRLAVPSAIAGNKMTFMIPSGLANGIYPVIAITGDGAFVDNVLSDIVLPEDENAIFRLSGDKKSIVCLYGFEAEGDVYIGATDGDLSTAANWLSGTVPTSGAPTIFCGSAATLSVGATFAPNTVVIPASSAVITIGMGDLTVNTLTNACKLSIAQGASLTVIGDLVANTTSSFLYCNEGFVTVNGNVVAHSPTENSTMTEYSSVTANTNPIKTQGLAYLDGGKYLYFKLISNNNKDGLWVIGKNGLTFPGSRSRSNCRFYTQNASATLYSSDDWTLANSGRSNTTGGDFEVYSNSSLTIDTSDYDDPTNVSKAHTVTLKGRIKADGNLTIAGCGKVVFDEEGSNPSLDEIYKHSSVASGKTIFVTDTATLKINAGKKITGNGTVSLAAGTTLALTATSKDFTPCIDPSLALPATGTATICIDGARLRSGDHVIASVVSGSADNVVPAGTALDGRRASFRVDNGVLVLNIQSNGTKIIVR